VDRSYVFRLIEALALADGKTVVETTEALRLNGLSAASTLEEMTSVLQRMAVIQAVPEKAQIADDTDPEAADTARLAAAMPADETQLLYSMCLHGRAELGLAPDEYAALTMVLLRLLAFKPGQSKAAAEKKTLIEAAPRVAQAAPTPVAAAPAAVPVAPAAPEPLPQAVAAPVVPAPPPVSVAPVIQMAPVPAPIAVPEASPKLSVPVTAVEPPQQATSAGPARATTALVHTEEGDFWHSTVQQLVATDAVTGLARELALQSQLVSHVDSRWVIRIERESLNQPMSRERLRVALDAINPGASLDVEVGQVVDSPGRRNAAATAEKQRIAEEIILGDPLVQSLMRDYGAKIVPGTLKPL